MGRAAARRLPQRRGRFFHEADDRQEADYGRPDGARISTHFTGAIHQLIRSAASECPGIDKRDG